MVENDKDLGPTALKLLRNALGHDDLQSEHHQVFFDEGLFSSPAHGKRVAEAVGGLESCDLHFEQSSKEVRGIQIADLVAHTCAIMLLGELGHMTKTVKLKNTGYPEDQPIELWFEMWAGVRYKFLSVRPKGSEEFIDTAMMEVEPHGLLVHESLPPLLVNATRNRFSKMYLGCIHEPTAAACP